MRFAIVFLSCFATPALAWNNGPDNQCPIPDYATHDWISDHA